MNWIRKKKQSVPNSTDAVGIDGMPKHLKKKLQEADIPKEQIANQTHNVLQALNAADISLRKLRAVMPKNDLEVEDKFRDYKRMSKGNPWSTYHRMKQLGKGAGGVVFKARSRVGDQAFVAVKVCPYKDLKYVQSEIAIQGFLKHENIVRLRETFIKPKQEITIVMEYCDSSLTNILGSHEYDVFPEPFIAYVTHGCLRGLEFMHTNFIIHRDIKSDNVLITKRGGVKLADFGFSKALSKAHQTRTSIVGTTFWMAPEVIRGDEYGASCDIWSLGITVIEMTDQTPPHMGMNEEKEHVEALLDTLLFPSPKPRESELWSKDLLNFLDRILAKGQAVRETSTQLLEDNAVFLNSRSTKKEFGQYVSSMLDLIRRRKKQLKAAKDLKL